jgi:hypothetical protein
LEGDAEALKTFQQRFSTDTPVTFGTDTPVTFGTDTPVTFGTDTPPFDPTETTSGNTELLTRMEPIFKIVMDAIMALRTRTGHESDGSSILIDRFLDDYAQHLSFYRWLDSEVRVIADYGFGVDAGVSEDHYLPDTLQRVAKSYRAGSSEFNMIVPLLLCPTNRKESSYGGFQNTSDIDDIMKALTDVLYHRGSHFENPGNTELFATFLQDIQCPEHAIRLIDPEIRKILESHCETTEGLEELSRKLKGRSDIPKEEGGVVEDDTSHSATHPSCGAAESDILDAAKHGNPIEISSKILAYLTLCEQNKASGTLTDGDRS